MPSWPTYNCLNKIISSHGRNSESQKQLFTRKKSPKKKKKEKRIFHRENKTKTKLKLIRRSHGVASLSLSLAFERTGTNKLREGQLVFNFAFFPI